MSPSLPLFMSLSTAICQIKGKNEPMKYKYKTKNAAAS